MTTFAEIASRNGITPSIREPERDVMAQLKALADPEHPKAAVFLARTNPIDFNALPKGIAIGKRTEGILLTKDRDLATLFEMAEVVTDEMLARILGYPESKADVIASGSGYVVQALDKDGAVITEACCSVARRDETLVALSPHVPNGGSLVTLSIVDALMRRMKDQH